MTKLNIKRSSDLEIFKAIIEKGLSLPCGWHCEIHLYHNGDIRFSGWGSGNSWCDLSYPGAPRYVGTVKAASWVDWEYREYANGQVCHMDLKGKYGRIGQREAIANIAEYYLRNNGYTEYIHEAWEKIQEEKTEKKKLKRR